MQTTSSTGSQESCRASIVRYREVVLLDLLEAGLSENLQVRQHRLRCSGSSARDRLRCGLLRRVVSAQHPSSERLPSSLPVPRLLLPPIAMHRPGAVARAAHGFVGIPLGGAGCSILQSCSPFLKLPGVPAGIPRPFADGSGREGCLPARSERSTSSTRRTSASLARAIDWPLRRPGL